jgi:hypothetical protein
MPYAHPWPRQSFVVLAWNNVPWCLAQAGNLHKGKGWYMVRKQTAMRWFHVSSVNLSINLERVWIFLKLLISLYSYSWFYLPLLLLLLSLFLCIKQFQRHHQSWHDRHIFEILFVLLFFVQPRFQNSDLNPVSLWSKKFVSLRPFRTCNLL